MKKPALLLSLITLIALVAVPVLGQLSKYGAKREKAPKGWHKFDWPEKKAILFGHYAPTSEELALIDKAVPKKPTVAPKKARKILLFYKTGYPHTSIATGVAAFQKMAKATGAFSVTLSDDGADFTPENLAQYDAILLNNTVAYESFLTDEQRQALLDFVAGGKGLIGIHAASDACKNWRPGAKLMGGVFRCHPWTAPGTWPAKLETPDHPLNAAWKGEGPWLRDEIYLYRDNTVKRERSRILLSVDMSKQRSFDGKYMANNQRRLLSEDGDYPIAWLHDHEKGRVFYSNLGHNNFTFWNATVLQHYLDGIQYALGDLEADATPSAKIDPKDLKIAPAKAKRIVFLAGAKSHGSGAHEFRAGSLLLAKRLNEQTQLPIQAEVISLWPEDDSVLDGADAIVIYCDYDSVHQNHYPRLMELSKNGTGLFFMHYGVHPKKIESGEKYYLPTVGGFMETGFSVNPHWVADLNIASDHPIRRGCEKPIKILDEWYYNMRFHKDAIPLATAIPTKDNLVQNNLWNKHGPAGFNKPQTLMWGYERPDGTRGGGFTGGHYHRNWAHHGYRKMILNTIVWMAGLEVPKDGIKASGVTEDELNENLDQKDNMKRIKLPLKKPMEYRQDIIDSRAARKKKITAKTPKTKKVTATPAKKTEWQQLLDMDLTHWEKWVGVPHKTVTIPGVEVDPNSNGMNGKPLGLNNDPLNVLTMIKEDGIPVLKITGQIYAGLTTKKEFENYHLSLEFKWGEKKWEPRLNRKRDSGLLLHCVGEHGAFWNVWKRCLECQVQEGDCGDFFALAGAIADIPVFKPEKGRPIYRPGGEFVRVHGSAQRSKNFEKPNGQWNTVEVHTVGDTMFFSVNGKENMALYNTREKVKGGGTRPLTKGQIQIQSEAAEVYYRNIKIRPISTLPN